MLVQTPFRIQMVNFPDVFSGTPKVFAEELVRRMRIVTPEGTITSIYIGDSTPAYNVGPWLRGKQWWVWDDNTNQYVPLDLGASERTWYTVSVNEPETSDPPVWIRKTADGKFVGVYIWSSSLNAWVPSNGIVFSGPTNLRPNPPVPLQQYYDTDIGCLIWYERNAWRTVSGVPGDIKFVAYETLSEALQRNPGWVLFGANEQAYRGRVISGATKDPGASPVTNLPVPSGVTPRAAFEVFGTGVTVAVSTTPPNAPYPTGIALWCLQKL
jgi:hypothetical protein